MTRANRLALPVGSYDMSCLAAEGGCRNFGSTRLQSSELIVECATLEPNEEYFFILYDPAKPASFVSCSDSVFIDPPRPRDLRPVVDADAEMDENVALDGPSTPRSHKSP